MSGTFDKGMQSLAAAATARRLYFAEHPSVASNIAAAAGALREATANVPEVVAHLVEERVLGPEGTLACSAEAREAVFAPLVARGFNSIAFSRAVSERDLRTLVDMLADSERVTEAVIGGVRLGSSTVSAAPERSGLGAPNVLTGELVQRYRSAWAPEQVGAGDPGVMEGVAAAVCASVLAARGTMLELAGLKHYDEYTYVHTVNVAMLSAALAETCGLSPEQVHTITLAALMHDIGKRVIPLAILTKKGPLDDAERAIMNRHPVEGARILMGQAEVPPMAIVVAFEHHMHLDGTGYPARPKGWGPNLAAQIVQQADVFDALRTHRPYRAAMPTEKACAILQEGSGSKYDPALVDAFVRRVAARAPLPKASEAASAAAA